MRDQDGPCDPWHDAWLGARAKWAREHHEELIREALVSAFGDAYTRLPDAERAVVAWDVTQTARKRFPSDFAPEIPELSPDRAASYLRRLIGGPDALAAYAAILGRFVSDPALIRHAMPWERIAFTIRDARAYGSWRLAWAVSRYQMVGARERKAGKLLVSAALGIGLGVIIIVVLDLKPMEPTFGMVYWSGLFIALYTIRRLWTRKK